MVLSSTRTPGCSAAEFPQPCPDHLQITAWEGWRDDRAVRCAALDPVRSGDGRDGGAQKAVDLLDGPARHDGHGGAQRFAQRGQQRGQVSGNVDRSGRRRDVDDGAVKI